MNELSDEIYDQIKALSSEGDEFAEAGCYQEALEKYCVAWDLLPEPKTNWDAALWIQAAIGDANFFRGDFETSLNNFLRAMQVEGAIGNPFLHLRIGQCEFELDNDERAVDEMCRAYMSEGFAIFENEDPKYFQLLKTRLQPPVGGWEDVKKSPWWKIW